MNFTVESVKRIYAHTINYKQGRLMNRWQHL